MAAYMGNKAVIDIKGTGEKIEAFMRRRNISAKQLQEYLGLSCVQSIYRWLNGSNLPSVDHLYAMSELFQVPVDEMICGNRKPFEIRIKNERFRRLMAYYQKCSGHHAA